MALKYPSAESVGVKRMLDYRHCADYESFIIQPPGAMGKDYRISIRATDKGTVQKPVYSYRNTDAYQRPDWQPLEAFEVLPPNILAQALLITKRLKVLLKELKKK
jgi:hypothetical protein